MELLLVIVGGGAVLAVASVVRNRPVVAIWREIAAKRGGKFSTVKALGPKRPVIECDVGTARVFAELCPEGRRLTQFRARYPIAAGPRFSIRFEHVTETLRKKLGSVDVELGLSAEFDDRFVVACDDPELTRRAWSWNLCHQLLALDHLHHLGSDAQTITLTLSGRISDPALVEGAIDLVGGLASVDLFSLDILASLPGGDYRPAAGSWDRRSRPTVEVSGPTPITIDLIEERGAPCTRVRCKDGGRDLIVAVDIEDDKPFGNGAAHVPEAARARLRGVGSGRLHLGAGGVQFRLSGVATSAAHLRAAIELVRAATAPSGGGVYR